MKERMTLIMKANASDNDMLEVYTTNCDRRYLAFVLHVDNLLPYFAEEINAMIDDGAEIEFLLSADN